MTIERGLRMSRKPLLVGLLISATSFSFLVVVGCSPSNPEKVSQADEPSGVAKAP
jgi:hypothetical protein